MHLRGLVLLLLYLAAGARRSTRINDSHQDVRQESNLTAGGLEVSAETREALIPGGIRTGVFRPAGPSTGALSKHHVAPSIRLGPRRAKDMKSNEKLAIKSNEKLHQLDAARASAVGLALLPAAAMAASALDDPTGIGIAQAFAFVTYVPQNFWLLLVFAPNWKVTRQVFEPLWPLCIVALFHVFIVVASAGKPPEAGTAPIELFNNLFNPAIVYDRGIDVYLELGKYKNFAAEEWTHISVWDLFVGRWIWLEGRRRNIFTSHSVLLTNLIGPPGLLLHALTVQAYAFFRPNTADARWADPEALRTATEGQPAAVAAATNEAAVEEATADEPQGFQLPELKLPDFKNPFGGGS